MSTVRRRKTRTAPRVFIRNQKWRVSKKTQKKEKEESRGPVRKDADKKYMREEGTKKAAKIVQD